MTSSFLAALALSASASASASAPASVPAAGPVSRYVDAMIGTAATGHTFPGAVRPHGMVQLSPDTGFSGWDHASGYNYSATAIMGFSHMHLSGTGGSDFGDILVAPTVGAVQLSPGDKDKPGDGYHSSFDHKDEVARAGYYSVFLKDPQVLAELTATPRVGIHRYTFPRTEKANLTFEITSQLGGQERTFSEARWVSPTELEGAIYTKGWAKQQKTHFVARFSQAASSYGVAVANKMEPGRTEASGALPLLDAYATFDASQGRPVVVKVALSAVDIAGARRNLDAEAPHFDFARYVREADSAWDAKLAATQVKGGTEAQKRSYYTALYHAYIHPSLYQDVDGKYLGMDMKVHQAAPGFVYHHVYSLWDTYRAAHPLFQLTEPSMNAHFVNGMLERYKIRGELPVWELASNETYTMIGTPAVPVVANAVVNGAPGIDKALALKAVTDSLNFKARGQAIFLENDWIPSDKESGSVSKTLEFSYSNGAAAKMALGMGRNAEAAAFWRRGLNYRHVFNSAQGLIWPKTSDGKWVVDFDPAQVDYSPPYITQANSWQYNWNTMHDVPGMIGLYPSREAFVAKLLAAFDPSNKALGKYHGLTGMIGQYNHGNEPGQHAPYLFAMAGRPDLTQQKVQQIRNELYADKPDGLPGNDDCGQTSAWYAFSALGFYPVDPASGEYVIGVPLFPEATLKLENGKSVRVLAKGFDPSKQAAKSVLWNGQPLANQRIKHAELVQGGTLEFRA